MQGRLLLGLKPVPTRETWNGISIGWVLELEFSNLCFCGGRKTRKLGGKPKEQGDNQQQTPPTSDGEYRNRTRVTEVGGERLSTVPPVLH